MTINKIPVIVLTGFLGSGKTTLLNRLIADGPKAGIIINEFGSAPIDQDLLEQTVTSMTVLGGGCLCCQIKGSLAPTLKNLWMAWQQAESKPFERIIIEASGVASPEPIIDTLLREPWLAKRYRLLAVLSTLAIPNASAQLARFPEALAQVVWADSLLLTQADLATEIELEALQQQLQRWVPGTPAFIATHGQVDTTKLLNRGGRFRRLPSGEIITEHGFRSLSLYLEQPLPWSMLEAKLDAIISKHKAGLVRIKGVVFLPGQHQPVAVHAVMGRLYPPQLLPLRQGGDRRGRLVFIMDGGGLEPLADALSVQFENPLGKSALRIH